MTDDNVTEYEDHEDMIKNGPKVISDIAARFSPDALYKLRTTDQIVQLVSIYENGTVKVWVDDKYNPAEDFRTGFKVFGINPDDLELWTPPLDG
jgi:hypothetical protein